MNGDKKYAQTTNMSYQGRENPLVPWQDAKQLRRPHGYSGPNQQAEESGRFHVVERFIHFAISSVIEESDLRIQRSDRVYYNYGARVCLSLFFMFYDHTRLTLHVHYPINLAAILFDSTREHGYNRYLQSYMPNWEIILAKVDAFRLDLSTQ